MLSKNLPICVSTKFNLPFFFAEEEGNLPLPHIQFELNI